ncbi:MAG: hypothetical protein OHK0039_08680 [Bacteroidia bacterium]
MIRRLYVIVLWLSASLLAWGQAWGQIRLEVVAHPPLILPEAGLFLAADFNGWNPGDPAYALRRGADGRFFIDLPDTLTTFAYKLTQGSWTVVEGDSAGGERANHVYRRETDSTYVPVRILSWQRRVFYRLVVTGVPDNTPLDAVLYIAGNFNNWKPADKSYRLQPQIDGRYRVSIYSDLDRLEFKFTRGSWETVEGDQSGRMRSNRIIARGDAIRDPIELHIESWEDLTGTFRIFSLFDMFLLFSAWLSVLLAVAIPAVPDHNRRANVWLLLLLLLMGGLILLRTVAFYREVAGDYPKLMLLPDLIWLGFAPLFYLYVDHLFLHRERLPGRWWLHFVPLLVQLLVYTPFLLMTSGALLELLLDPGRIGHRVFGIVSGLALVVNAYYWVRLQRRLQAYRRQAQAEASYEANLHYLQAIMAILALCLGLWTIASLVAVYGWIWGGDVQALADSATSTAWLVLAMVPYVLGYMAIRQPEVLRVLEAGQIGYMVQTRFAEEKAAGAVEPRAESPGEEPYKALAKRLEQAMNRQKPYTNPKLTLNDLAQQLEVQPYLLSKLINEHYDKNFFDFVNQYRVEAFIQRAKVPEYKDYTLLSIALDVGFNSKTAFNRAFKKVTDQSPSAYLADHRQEA